MFNYCPKCASKNINLTKNKFQCPDCGLVYFHNTAAATGCIISARDKDGEKLLFTVRGKEPGKGLLDLPGGFVDPGEGILDGLYRELREELGWAPPVPAGKSLSDVLKLFASFPNVYRYKDFDYNTCDVYFTASAPGLTQRDLNPEKAEIAEVRFLKPEEINFDNFAFDSVKRAVKAYLLRANADCKPTTANRQA